MVKNAFVTWTKNRKENTNVLAFTFTNLKKENERGGIFSYSVGRQNDKLDKKNNKVKQFYANLSFQQDQQQ
jgi:hypothetical protein